MSDTKAAEVEAANASAIPNFRKKGAQLRSLTDVQCSNPSYYLNGTFYARVTAFTNEGTEYIRFEAVDMFCLSGGVATVRADEMPMSYAQFVEYGDQADDKVMRFCWVTDEKANRVKIVIGKGVECDAVEFRKIKWSVELEPVSDTELSTISTQIRGARKIRQALAKFISRNVGGGPRPVARGADLSGLLHALMTHSSPSDD